MVLIRSIPLTLIPSSQPCNPNFVQARDAILDADKKMTGGDNQCEIWKGFAKRGLGEGAAFGTKRTGSNKIPDGVCCDDDASSN